MIRYATTRNFLGAVQPRPCRATLRSAGIDISTPREIVIHPGDSLWIDTGLRFAIPSGCAGLIRSRSGLRRNYRISAFGGTIDPDYRGEVAVELVRDDYEAPSVTLEAGTRIAQLVIVPYLDTMLDLADLDATERGSGGFGSTGE